MIKTIQLLLIVILAALLAGCATFRGVDSNGETELELATITADSLLSQLPNYSDELHTIDGTGRALVSEPGQSDRVIINFQSTRSTSLITIRTGTGIEGGKILVDGDSLLIYNTVDRIAEKVSVTQSNLSSVGSIASLNMLDLFNFVIKPEEIDQIFDDGRSYILFLNNEATIKISKTGFFVEEVNQPAGAPGRAYRKIEYEGYSDISGFQLPRKITILSSDEQSRAVFLVQRLHVNGKLPPLTIDIPDNVEIRRP